MKRTLRLLLIEDSKDDADLLLREIRKDYQVEFECVDTPHALQTALARSGWDLILCDYSLPGFNAPAALELVKAAGLDLPFIIISGTIDEETAVAVLQAGAHDFLIKGRYARLAPAIERELREAVIRGEQRRAGQALKEKERHLSEAQRIARLGSLSYEIPTDALVFSEELYRLLDIAAQGFPHTGQAFLDLVYTPDRSRIQAWLEEIRSGQPPREVEFRIFRGNGELRHLHARGRLEYGTSQKPERFVGTIQDISERKQSEIQIRQQLEQLTALREIDRAIASSFDLHHVLETVLEQVPAQLRVDAADILLLAGDGQHLEYAAARGFRSPAVQTARLDLSASPAGRAVRERRSIHIADLAGAHADARADGPLAGEGFVCYFGVPLIAKSRILGVLEAFHRSPLLPTPEWLAFLDTLAGQAAIAIDNATLFDNLQRTNADLTLAYDETIEGWSRALDLRDQETEGHTQRVTIITLHLARIMGIDEERMVHIRRGALLHDIGKMGVPDRILLKKGSLTDSEMQVMRKHPALALDLLQPIAYLSPALEIPYCHHEHWDGSGYPRGLKGGEIPLAARIFTVADVWDALTSDRRYRKAKSPQEALGYIRTNSGTYFDPRVVEVFIRELPHLPGPGSLPSE